MHSRIFALPTLAVFVALASRGPANHRHPVMAVGHGHAAVSHARHAAVSHARHARRSSVLLCPTPSALEKGSSMTGCTVRVTGAGAWVSRPDASATPTR